MKYLVLAGSGEFTSAMESVDKYLPSLITSTDPQVAILPTAAGQESDVLKWIEKGNSHYKRLNIQSFGVPVLNRQNAENSLFVNQLDKASIIYFSGGDPGYLLESIIDTSLIHKVLEKYKQGDILVGSSAGAMVCGSYVLSNIKNLDSTNLVPQWKSALNLIPYAIFPHFDVIEDSFSTMMPKILAAMKESGCTQWLGIDEDTAFVVTNKTEAKVLGKGRVVVTKADKVVAYQHNDTFIL